MKLTSVKWCPPWPGFNVFREACRVRDWTVQIDVEGRSIRGRLRAENCTEGNPKFPCSESPGAGTPRAGSTQDGVDSKHELNTRNFMKSRRPFWMMSSGILWCDAITDDLRNLEDYYLTFQSGRLSKQSWGWWFETLPSPLWRHSNDNSDQIRVTWIYGTGTLKVKFLQHFTIPNLCMQIENKDGMVNLKIDNNGVIEILADDILSGLINMITMRNYTRVDRKMICQGPVSICEKTSFRKIS